MTEVDLPEPDRLTGTPHPRETDRLIGQRDAEQAFLNAYRDGTLHHAWLLIGPEGVGKATLAWRIARFLLATPAMGSVAPALFGDVPGTEPPSSLDIDPNHPVARRVAALSEPRLFLVRRGANSRGNALSSEIRVDEIRKLADFLHLSAADGGRRVVVVDSADEMNVSAANALLKFLEEPPEGLTFLLVSHRPSALLPTIRSRCRTLRLGPLPEPDLKVALAGAGLAIEGADSALALLSGGSPGRAARMSLLDAPALYDRILALGSLLPKLDHQAAVAFAERSGRRGAEDETDLTFELIGVFLARLARRGSTGEAEGEIREGEAAILGRLSPSADAGREWAVLSQEVDARVQHGRAVNLDPATLLLDTVLRISETASRVAAG